MTKIAILCPTRGRPEQCLRMYRSVDRTQSTGVKVCAVLANDDPEDYSKVMEFDPTSKTPPWPTVHSWNHAAKLVYEQMPDVKLFMLGADDIIFETSGWDKALIDHYNALENKIHVYHLRDSRNPDGTPHPVVTREYIEAMGYFMAPIFLHWYIDTWCCAVASSCGVFTHLKGYLLTHDKPSDRGEPDETHSRIRRMGWHTRDQYVNDTCQHFLEFEKKRLLLKIRQSQFPGLAPKSMGEVWPEMA